MIDTKKKKNANGRSSEHFQAHNNGRKSYEQTCIWLEDKF